MSEDLNLQAEMPTQAEIEEWYRLDEQLAQIKEREAELRRKIARAYFPQPREGTNNIPMSNGFVMKMGHNINRSVLKAEINVFAAELVAAKIPIDDLIEYKPNLVLKEYRKLTAEQQKLVDQRILEVKDGMPSLEIVKPKRGVK